MNPGLAARVLRTAADGSTGEAAGTNSQGQRVSQTLMVLIALWASASVA